MSPIRFLAVLALVVLVGCERPFVEEVPPTITILAPDFETVVPSGDVEVVLRVESARRALEAVRVNGTPAVLDAESGTYRVPLTLAPGVTEVVVEAEDAGGNVARASRFGVYLPSRFEIDPSVQLPEGVGGHAAVRLRDGRVLVTGGAGTFDGPATDRATLFDPATGTFAPLPSGMQERRAGHTATRLPDGRVLLAGGASTARPTALADLVNDAEVFDPATGQFTRVPLLEDSPPLERTQHAAHVVAAQGRTFVYLIGGRGRLSFSGTTFGTRSDFRLAELVDRDGRLAVSSAVNLGPSFSSAQQALSAFAFVPLDAPDAEGFGDFLLAGTYAREVGAEFAVDSVALAISFSLDGYRDRARPPMRVARAEHAGALVEPGLVLLAGGRVFGRGAPVGSAEVYVAAAERFLAFPATEDAPRLARPRFGHTATNLGDGRILVLGGFDEAGRGVPLAEFFAVTEAP